MGIIRFLQLRDTPDSYSGQAGKVPKVKSTEDGLEFGITEIKDNRIAGEDLAKAKAVFMAGGSIPEELIVSQETYSTGSEMAAGLQWLAQTFKLLKTSKITKISLYLHRYGNPTGDFIVSIRNADALSGPTGDDIVSASVSASSIPTSNGWYTFTFTPTEFSANSLYAIVCRCPNGDIDNHIRWHTVGDVYADGKFFLATNINLGWLRYDNEDATFRIYGTLLPGYVYKANAAYYDERIQKFIGFTDESKSADQIIKITESGIQNGFSSLSKGSLYYLTDTPGEIGTTPGTIKKVVAIAVSDTEILVIQEMAPILSYGFVASETLQNSNDTERSTTSIIPVKLKECKLNADLPACRIKFDIRAGTFGGRLYHHAQIYKNGIPIGTLQTADSDSYTTKTEDFTGFHKNDLIQIYGYLDFYYTGYQVFVQNFRFYYDKQLTGFGNEVLTTPLPLVTTAISITNQDP
jgi:hypothetical protein